MRNTLQLDTIPTEETVKTYSEHLLAELEQLMRRVRPKAGGVPRAGNPGGAPQVKAAFKSMRRREMEAQKARVPASADTFEPMQDVEEEVPADGCAKLNLEKRGAMSVELPATMLRIALETS